ncbi:hypothetical protein PIB30_051364 [Stylosanthes scabra]|uniref:Uncharacterized protein n=1 Tax=Stylosanthes scabra TaxID=79078 RepID=A0ABU6QIK9_9FABA|nr:hypothetical protein [Stylosanthes scabra]
MSCSEEGVRVSLWLSDGKPSRCLWRRKEYLRRHSCPPPPSHRRRPATRVLAAAAIKRPLQPPQQLAPSPPANADSSFKPDNNECTQAISDVIELMLNEPWINYSDVPADEGFTWPEEQKKQIKKAYDYRAGRRYQQIMADLRDGELQRLKWMSETLRGQLLHRFATDEGFKKRQASSKKNRASSKGGCLHTGGSSTILKTRARMVTHLLIYVMNVLGQLITYLYVNLIVTYLRPF